MTGKLIRIDQIDIPPEYEREESVEDDFLRNSIKDSGVLDPINVLLLRNGRYGLIKGGRRIRISHELGLVNIPAVVDQLPVDVDPRSYQDRIRFLLDEHQQDPFPSQRAWLIRQMMTMFYMTQASVADYLGMNAGTITNWMRIEAYSPEVKHAIDIGETTLHQAWLRTKSPQQKRRKPKLTRNEKELLSRDVDLKQVELEEGKAELMRLSREITLCTPLVHAILRDSELVAMSPREVVPELERFAEVY